jgi:putative NIF3 family GTP cyclohydrolase 1 type 2
MAEEAGSGVIGRLPEPLDEQDFLFRLKHVLNIPVLRHSGFVGRAVSRVALCGGAGSFLLRSALEQKADVFITADLKYHDFFIPDNKLLLIDAGHYETEQFTTSLLLDILHQNFTNFAARISHLSTNAVNYLI